MKLKSIALLCLSISLFLQAQTQDKKWSFGINYSPAISYRLLFSEAHSYTDDIESPMLTHSADVSIGLHLNERVMLLSGLGYQSYGVKSTWDELMFGDMVDSRYSYIYSASLDTITSAEINSTYNYLSIPFLVNYSFLQKAKSDFSVEAGVIANFYLNSKSRSKYIVNGDEEKENSTYNGNLTPNLSSHIGVFYKYPVSEKFDLKVGPSFTMFLRSTNQLINKTGYNPYRIAMNLGMEF